MRFVCRSCGIHDLKDAFSWGIIESFDNAGISTASATTEIVGLATLSVKMEDQMRM